MAWRMDNQHACRWMPMARQQKGTSNLLPSHTSPQRLPARLPHHGPRRAWRCVIQIFFYTSRDWTMQDDDGDDDDSSTLFCSPQACLLGYASLQ